MKNILKILVIGMIMISGCSTEEDPKVEISNEEMLAGSSSKNWALTYQETYQDGQKVAEGDALACDNDNVFTFKASGNYTMNEGATKCDDGNPSELNGLWTFANDYSQLIINTGDVQTTYSIISLSSDKLIVEQTTYWFVLRNTFVKK